MNNIINNYKIVTPVAKVPVEKVEIRKEKVTSIFNVHHVEVSKIWENQLENIEYVVELDWDESVGSKDNLDGIKRKQFIKWVEGENIEKYIEKENIFDESVEVDFDKSMKYLIYNTPSYESFRDKCFSFGFYSDHNLLDYFDKQEIEKEF